MAGRPRPAEKRPAEGAAPCIVELMTQGVYGNMHCESLKPILKSSGHIFYETIRGGPQKIFYPFQICQKHNLLFFKWLCFLSPIAPAFLYILYL